MKAIIQRVTAAKVTVDNEIVGRIDNGMVILLGVGKADTVMTCSQMWRKIKNLRIFQDENDKTNLNLDAVAGSVLVVSQFTLYADCKRGNRPSFFAAAPPAESRLLYEQFISLAVADIGRQRVATGSFGAMMDVELTNSGPFTIYLDSDNL